MQDSPHNFGERGVLSERNQDASQVIAEWAFIVVGPRFQSREVNPFAHHLVQSPARQVRVTAHQTLEPRNFGWGAHR